MNYEFIATLATIIIASVAVIGLILRMEQRLEKRMNERMTSLEQRMNERMEKLEQRMDELSARVSELGERVARIEGLLEGYFASLRGTNGDPPST